MEVAQPIESAAFREEVIQSALNSSKVICETARELELSLETLQGLVKNQEKQDYPPPDPEPTVSEDEHPKEREQPLHEVENDPPADPEPTVSEGEHLKELERRLREVEAENAFLKRAAAYFAKEVR